MNRSANILQAFVSAFAFTGFVAAVAPADAATLRVGAAAVELLADDSMIVGGSVFPKIANGQEGELRATALVVEQAGADTLAIVSCDVVGVTRDIVDPALVEIEKTLGIPPDHVLVHATHTHHAPSTVRDLACGRCEVFVEQLTKAIVRAVAQARAKLADTTCFFHMGEERTVGMNSRLLLKDGTIFWSGPRDDDVGPTGPFDADLPVLAFRNPAGQLQALVFGHSTHAQGTLRPGVRSPAFYGMAALALEEELGGTVAFVGGASGSTHLLNMEPQEAFRRIKAAVLTTLDQAQPQEVQRVAGIKRPFVFKIRHFDEAAEEKAVSDYCRKRLPSRADSYIPVFGQMRKELAPLQGQDRTTALQAMVIGDVAIVGVPCELFTKLGLEIKRRSPFKHTIVANLANDWIGYISDREDYKLGGYQIWTGFGSYAEAGTGERMIDQTVAMLNELAGRKPGASSESDPGVR